MAVNNTTIAGRVWLSGTNDFQLAVFKEPSQRYGSTIQESAIKWITMRGRRLQSMTARSSATSTGTGTWTR